MYFFLNQVKSLHFNNYFLVFFKLCLFTMASNTTSTLKIKSIIINRSYGGWGVSKQAVELYNKITKKKYTSRNLREDLREDLDLIKIVTILGPEANGEYSDLKVVEVVEKYYKIAEYDGKETVYFTENLSVDMMEKIITDQTLTDQEKINILRMACQERHDARQLFSTLNKKIDLF